MTDDALVTPAASNVRWPAELARMFDVTRHAIEQTRNPGDPGALALSVVLAIARDMGGRPVYLPRGVVVKKALRDRKLYSEFTGFNHHELAERYDLCTQTVYKIIAEQKQATRRPPL